jgi:hypothetical protein
MMMVVVVTMTYINAIYLNVLIERKQSVGICSVSSEEVLAVGMIVLPQYKPKNNHLSYFFTLPNDIQVFCHSTLNNLCRRCSSREVQVSVTLTEVVVLIFNSSSGMLSKAVGEDTVTTNERPEYPS